MIAPKRQAARIASAIAAELEAQTRQRSPGFSPRRANSPASAIAPRCRLAKLVARSPWNKAGAWAFAAAVASNLRQSSPDIASALLRRRLQLGIKEIRRTA